MSQYVNPQIVLPDDVDTAEMEAVAPRSVTEHLAQAGEVARDENGEPIRDWHGEPFKVPPSSPVEINVAASNAEIGPVNARDAAQEPAPPMVPEGVRTVVYFVLLFASALVFIASQLAPIWLGVELADKILASAAPLAGLLGMIAGGLGVAYRPQAAP